jgi:hypothetical protein
VAEKSWQLASGIRKRTRRLTIQRVYPEALKMLGKLLEGTPHVRTFDVVSSPPQKVAPPAWPPDLEQNETRGSLDAAVGYSLGYQREEFFMVRGPEEVSEIRIDDPL